MDSSPTRNHFLSVPWLDLFLGGLGLAALLALSGLLARLPGRALVLACLLYLGLALIISAGLAVSGSRFGPADRVTLLRAVLVLFLTTLTGFPELLQGLAWPYLFLCLAALAMDGADGFVARRTGSASAFGARFDMELDAFFVLTLCLAVMVLGKAGPWVLLIGLMRYGFVMAGWFFSWLDKPLPERLRRKTVCVWQLVTLMVALLPWAPERFAHATLLMALVLLMWSFALDIRYLHKQRRTRSLR